MEPKYSPGSVMPEPNPPTLAAPPPCKHQHLVPLELQFAKLTYPDGYTKPADYDYSSTIMAAHRCRVKSYLCLDCCEEIMAPKRKE